MPSLRSTGARYGMNDRISPTGGGGTSLIDIITGNTPNKLQKQRQDWEVQMEQLAHKHAIELKNLQDTITKSADFRKSAPPGSVDAKGELTPAGKQWMDNTYFQQQMNATAMGAAGAQEAVNKDFIATQQKTDVENRAKLKQDPQMGATSFIPGPLGDPNKGTTVSGALPRTTTTQMVTKQMPMPGPDGTMELTPMEFHPAITQSTLPGKVSIGGQPNLMSISPEDVQKAQPKQSPVPDTSGFMNFGQSMGIGQQPLPQFSPVPANNMNSQGTPTRLPPTLRDNALPPGISPNILNTLLQSLGMYPNNTPMTNQFQGRFGGY